MDSKQTKKKSNHQKNINNEDDNSGYGNGEQNIPDKSKENNSIVSKDNNSQDVKSNRSFGKDLNDQRENLPKHAKPKLSSVSNVSSVKCQLPDFDGLTSAVGQSGAHTDNVLTTTVPNTEKIKTAGIAPYNAADSLESDDRPRTLSLLLSAKEQAHLNEIIKSDHNEIYKTTHGHPSPQQVLPSKVIQSSVDVDPTDLNKSHQRPRKESIQSQTVTSSTKLTETKTPVITNERLGMVKSSTTCNSKYPSVDISITIGNHRLPGTAENVPNPTERTTSKGNPGFTGGLSEETLYVRVTRKLPSTGPLAISDLDDFLKKSKMDFEHFYYKKPISSIQISDFNLVKTLGIGAFGKVVLGELKKDKTLYAIKVIDKIGVVKRNHVRYVSNEKRVLQALNFPFVINLKYFFTDFYYLYLVMPYIPGGNFYKHLKVYQKLPESEARFYIGQLVLALEYLHSLELIHRDMKTENVMIDAFGYLKLVDFGQCVRCYGNDKTWTFTGTPDYMAPEIIVGKGYDCAVDWWALGIITFEICAGFRPFKNENSRKLQLLILCNQYSVPNSFSRSLKKLIESLLVIEPKKRIANYIKKASMIKKHVWFKGLDWLALLNRRLEAPYVPSLKKTSTKLQGKVE